MQHLRALNITYDSLPQTPFTIRIKKRGKEGLPSMQHFYTVTDTMLNLVKLEVTLNILELDEPLRYQPDEMVCMYSFLPN